MTYPMSAGLSACSVMATPISDKTITRNVSVSVM
jgi:hypothetical protein